MRARLERNLAHAGKGSFHSAIAEDASRPCGRERCTMPYEVSVITAEPGSSARTLAYRAAQRELSCGPSSRTVRTHASVRPSDQLRHVVVLSQVLTDERSERQLGDLDELDRTARHFHRLPPAHMRVKGPRRGGTGRSAPRRATSGGAFRWRM